MKLFLAGLISLAPIFANAEVTCKAKPHLGDEVPFVRDDRNAPEGTVFLKAFNQMGSFEATIKNDTEVKIQFFFLEDRHSTVATLGHNKSVTLNIETERGYQASATCSRD